MVFSNTPKLQISKDIIKYGLETSLLLQTIVCKGVLAPLFLRDQPLEPAYPPFLKSLCPLPSFLFHPLLRYFGLNKYQKGEFTSSTIAFYQKSILIFQILLEIGYLDLWYIFRFIFRQLRMIFWTYNHLINLEKIK